MGEDKHSKVESLARRMAGGLFALVFVTVDHSKVESLARRMAGLLDDVLTVYAGEYPSAWLFREIRDILAEAKETLGL